MSNEKKQGLTVGKFIGFIAVLLSALYALMLFGYLDSIRLELFGMIATSIAMPHMLCVAAALVFSIVGLFGQKKWCMLVAGILMGVSVLFMPDNVFFVAIPALFLLFAYAEMD